MLIPSRTDTTWWHEYVMKGDVYLIKGRLKFINRLLPSWRSDGNFKLVSAPFPSAIVVWGENKPNIKAPYCINTNNTLIRSLYVRKQSISKRVKNK